MCFFFCVFIFSCNLKTRLIDSFVWFCFVCWFPTAEWVKWACKINCGSLPMPCVSVEFCFVLFCFVYLFVCSLYSLGRQIGNCWNGKWLKRIRRTTNEKDESLVKRKKSSSHWMEAQHVRFMFFIAQTRSYVSYWLLYNISNSLHYNDVSFPFFIPRFVSIIFFVFFIEQKNVQKTWNSFHSN